jgi:hypothetical protein
MKITASYPLFKNMNIVICHPADYPAIAFYRYCNSLKKGSFDLINADVLTCAFKWNFTLKNEGNTGLEILLHNGKTLSLKSTGSVFNRMQYVNLGMWNYAKPEEKDYITQELYSFFVSWLFSFKGRITNIPSPQSLFGAHLEPIAWRKSAADLGINVKETLSCETEAGRERKKLKKYAYVIGNKTCGYIPPNTAPESLTALALENNVDFLEVEFESSKGEWEFVNATSLPLSFHNDNTVLKILYEHLTGKESIQ